MIIRTNIGLESHGIGSSIVNQLTQNAIGVANLIKSSDIKLSEGGDWPPEWVLVQEIEVMDVDAFKSGLESLCLVLGEDAIAVAILSPNVGHGVVLFSPSYTGTKYSFNLDYFVG